MRGGGVKSGQASNTIGNEFGRHLFLLAAHFYIPLINPFAPGDFAKKRVLKLVEWFSGHCRAIKS